MQTASKLLSQFTSAYVRKSRVILRSIVYSFSKLRNDAGARTVDVEQLLNRWLNALIKEDRQEFWSYCHVHRRAVLDGLLLADQLHIALQDYYPAAQACISL